ncbi:MAG: LytTR family DNA-binding domain-containing protein [Gemmatimonadaceae bacterium]
MIRAAIVDDEQLARRGIRQLLASHGDVEVVAECRNGREAAELLASEPPDLLFLDIQMPEMTGFDVLRGAEVRPVTIFLTAYEEFAVEAFEVEALDYLVKPVSQERFDAALARARKRISSAPKHVVVHEAQGRRVIPVDEIDWIGADDYYAAIHTGGRRYLLRETMASLEARLDVAKFVRVHRSAIVNVTRVRELKRQEGDAELILRDGTKLPVSRRRRAKLVELLGDAR